MSNSKSVAIHKRVNVEKAGTMSNGGTPERPNFWSTNEITEDSLIQTCRA